MRLGLIWTSWDLLFWSDQRSEEVFDPRCGLREISHLQFWFRSNWKVWNEADMKDSGRNILSVNCHDGRRRLEVFISSNETWRTGASVMCLHKSSSHHNVFAVLLMFVTSSIISIVDKYQICCGEKKKTCGELLTVSGSGDIRAESLHTTHYLNLSSIANSEWAWLEQTGLTAEIRLTVVKCVPALVSELYWCFSTLVQSLAYLSPSFHSLSFFLPEFHL